MPRTDSHDQQRSDASWLIWLAAETTWLSWVRTGLSAAAVAIGVGGVLPHVSSGDDWPYRLLGLGYAVLAAAIFVVGAIRHRRIARAVRHGEPHTPLVSFVTWLTIAAIALTAATLTVLAIEP